MEPEREAVHRERSGRAARGGLAAGEVPLPREGEGEAAGVAVASSVCSRAIASVWIEMSSQSRCGCGIAITACCMVRMLWHQAAGGVFSGSAAARDARSGNRVIHRWKYGMTVSTLVCWSMNSETRVA